MPKWPVLPTEEDKEEQRVNKIVLAIQAALPTGARESDVIKALRRVLDAFETARRLNMKSD